MDKQRIFIDQIAGDEAAGKAGAAVGDDRPAVPRLEPGDFLDQSAAGHMGCGPAVRAGLKRHALRLSGGPQNRRSLPGKDRLGDPVHRLGERQGRGRPIAGHVLERAAAHDVQAGVADGLQNPGLGLRVVAEYPVDFAPGAGNEAVERQGHPQDQLPHRAPLISSG